MKLKKTILGAVAALSAGLGAFAQNEAVLRPVTSVYTVEAGSSYLCDTYMTPLKYGGWQMALGYERWQAMRFDPENWVMNLGGRLSVDRTLTPARNAVLWGLDLRLDWAMMRRFDIASVPGLTLAAGGQTTLNGGVLYLNRNSNNPASAKAAWTVGVTGQATYSLTLGRLPVVLGYRPSLPLLGCFFSPDYDELYYEIYLGNHSGLAHVAWPGSFFRFDQLLSADLRFGATALRVGYRCNILSTKASNIVSRQISHCISLGISGEWLPVDRGGKLSDEARIISAYY